MDLLLISGAGLPSWIWDETRRELEHDAHTTRVADRPGPGASLDDYVAAALQSAPAGRFAVVAHSAGGVIGAELARRAPDRVTDLIGLSAVVPPPGGSFLTAMPAPNRWLLGLVMRVAGTRPPESAVRRGLAKGLDEETTQRLLSDLLSESPHLFRGRTGRGAITARCAYVATTRDAELSPALQRRFEQQLGATRSASLERASLDTGHLPMLEDPAGTARAVTRLLAP